MDLSSIFSGVEAAIATAIATTVVGWLVSMARRNGVEVTAKQQELLRKAAFEAVEAVEEEVAADVKRHIRKMNPAEKLSKAVEILKERFGISEYKAENLVRSVLAHANLGAQVQKQVEFEAVPGLTRAN